MTMYYRLPTKNRQALVIAISIIGYVTLLATADFLFPMLSDSTKKKLTQAGLVLLYLASLSAGLAFTWSSKAKSNVKLAASNKALAEKHLDVLRDQAQLLCKGFEKSIEAAENTIKEADSEIAIAEKLPSVYDFSGSISLILVAVGTLLCFIGAG